MNLKATLIILIIFLIASSLCGGSQLPQAKIVYAKEVDSKQYTTHCGRYDLFMRKMPNGKEIRLTTNGARKYRSLGGAIREPNRWWSKDGQWLILKKINTKAGFSEELLALETSTGNHKYIFKQVTNTNGIDWHELK